MDRFHESQSWSKPQQSYSYMNLNTPVDSDKPRLFHSNIIRLGRSGGQQVQLISIGKD